MLFKNTIFFLFLITENKKQLLLIKLVFFIFFVLHNIEPYLKTATDHVLTNFLWFNISLVCKNRVIEWGNPGVGNCEMETQPMNGSTYPAGLPRASHVLEEVSRSMTKPIHLLNITKGLQKARDPARQARAHFWVSRAMGPNLGPASLWARHLNIYIYIKIYSRNRKCYINKNIHF